MIPYAHIPPHLRLSDRHLMIQDYPGGAEWWAKEESRASMCTVDSFRGSSRRNADHAIMLQMLERGPATASEICVAVGAKNYAKVERLADGLTYSAAIWEEKRGNTLVYGLVV